MSNPEHPPAPSLRPGELDPILADLRDTHAAIERRVSRRSRFAAAGAYRLRRCAPVPVRYRPQARCCSRLGPWTTMLRTRRRLPLALGLPDTAESPGFSADDPLARCRKAGDRSGRGLPDRLRRRLRPSSGRRRGSAQRGGCFRGRRGRASGSAAAVHRHSNQAAVAGASRSRPADAGSVRDNAGQDGGFVVSGAADRHDSEGRRRGSGLCRMRAPARCWSAGWACARGPCGWSS